MKKKHYFGRTVDFLLCAVFAVAFLLPTVVTITNSFMSEAEINANYGAVFASGGGGFVSNTVNLKFIPDKVVFTQYIRGLVDAPDYLDKFWNSVLLVV
ncbi:MAG: carbohydrate ABC transporter permease, partial [Oscillospiraceae bacterium]|nr:carbohydrate ABC transporter permease [Oscillospiraceae bacterium]